MPESGPVKTIDDFKSRKVGVQAATNCRCFTFKRKITVAESQRKGNFPQKDVPVLRQCGLEIVIPAYTADQFSNGDILRMR